jgi:undecaprenyl diphosphate synthase
MSETETRVVPRHVCLILDGNRRWARARNLPLMEGHRQGFENFKVVSKHALDSGVEVLSAFIFSTENWSRSTEEVSYLMNLLLKVIENDLRELHNDGIKILILGTRQKLDKKIIDAIERTEELTKHNTKGLLCLCFNYGGHQEIIEAVQALVAKGVAPDAITRQTLDEFMYGGTEVPPVDLMIRTSGEKRLSGCMLWRSDYAELYFDDVMWPDFGPDRFDEAINEYNRRQRRFGG